VASEPTQFHVTRHGDQWRITRGEQVILESAIKEEAIKEAEAAARMAHPSRLVIHNPDGTIDAERTYEDDPYRPVRKPRRRHA
jgi:hypothetical protein